MKKPSNLKLITYAIAIASGLPMSSAHAQLGGVSGSADDFAAAAPPPDPNGYFLVARVHFGLAPGLSPSRQPLGPHSVIMYESRWLELPASAALSVPSVPNLSNGSLVRRYCVFPSIAIQEIVRPTVASMSPPWDGNFTLNLVELGTPKTTPVFAPIQVTGPIPANTTRFIGPTWPPSDLPADPKPWCGQTAPGAPLPSLYLVVNGRPEVKVIWAGTPVFLPLRDASAAAEPSASPAAASSPR